MRRLGKLQRAIVNVLTEPLTPEEIAYALRRQGGWPGIEAQAVRDSLARLEERALVRCGRDLTARFRLTHKGLRVAGY